VDPEKWRGNMPSIKEEESKESDGNSFLEMMKQKMKEKAHLEV
jgi:hypothetical protein